eukprot:snap_masked-scaffold1258_size52332-processed-gene-0.3 protein:Tk02593 transcript:snap_masked-scaffold1258_size52332-processed-gene-0.3-mRNA-1 annotation:"beta- -galactosyltransferase 6-like"
MPFGNVTQIPARLWTTFPKGSQISTSNFQVMDPSCIHHLDPGHQGLRELQDGYHGLKSKKAFLVIVIISSPRNFERRQAIRETWINLPKALRSEVLHLFVLGDLTLSGSEEKDIESESLTHKDLLRLPMEESFDLLTKKVLSTLVQVDRNIDFKYLMKVDDDSFVIVPRVLEELQNSNYDRALYWGFFDGRAPVFVSEKNKYRETDYNLCDRYIPYALGGGYVLSQDLVHFIAENSEDLKVFKNEDVSVGTWLAPLKVNRVHDVRFDTEFRSRGCQNTYLVSHKQSVAEMKSKQYSLTANSLLCEKETVLRKAYEYNWKEPPSKFTKDG